MTFWIELTTTVLLGTGTSVTQAAMRELAKAGVLVGFCGGGGTPLFSAAEFEVEVAWLSPQSEYRPTEYLQHWVKFWFDDNLRLTAAQAFQQARLKRIRQHWITSRGLKDQKFTVDEVALEGLLDQSSHAITKATDNTTLLTDEARLTKQLYKLAAYGNYLAYGLAATATATATWVLGLPHGLAVLHGKTRRGGLAFDVADLVKDAVCRTGSSENVCSTTRAVSAFTVAQAAQKNPQNGQEYLELFTAAQATQK